MCGGLSLVIVNLGNNLKTALSLMLILDKERLLELSGFHTLCSEIPANPRYAFNECTRTDQLEVEDSQ